VKNNFLILAGALLVSNFSSAAQKHVPNISDLFANASPQVDLGAAKLDASKELVFKKGVNYWEGRFEDIGHSDLIFSKAVVPYSASHGDTSSHDGCFMLLRRAEKQRDNAGETVTVAAGSEFITQKASYNTDADWMMLTLSLHEGKAEEKAFVICEGFATVDQLRQGLAEIGLVGTLPAIKPEQIEASNGKAKRGVASDKKKAK
jgi:hypothetical protein